MSVLRTPGQTSFAFVFDLARTVDEMKQEIESRRTEASRSRVGRPNPLAAGQRDGRSKTPTGSIPVSATNSS